MDIDKFNKLKDSVQSYNEDQKTNYKALKIVKQCYKLYQSACVDKAKEIGADKELTYIFSYFVDQLAQMAKVLKENDDYYPPEIDFDGIYVFLDRINAL